MKNYNDIKIDITKLSTLTDSANKYAEIVGYGDCLKNSSSALLKEKAEKISRHKVSVPYGDRVYLNTVSGNALFWLAPEAVCGANAVPPLLPQFLSLKIRKKPVKSGRGAKIIFLTLRQSPVCPFPYHIAFLDTSCICIHAVRFPSQDLADACVDHRFFLITSYGIYYP